MNVWWKFGICDFIFWDSMQNSWLNLKIRNLEYFGNCDARLVMLVCFCCLSFHERGRELCHVIDCYYVFVFLCTMWCSLTIDESSFVCLFTRRLCQGRPPPTLSQFSEIGRTRSQSRVNRLEPKIYALWLKVGFLLESE